MDTPYTETIRRDPNWSWLFAERYYFWLGSEAEKPLNVRPDNWEQFDRVVPEALK